MASFPLSAQFPNPLLLLPAISSLKNFHSILVSDLLLGSDLDTHQRGDGIVVFYCCVTSYHKLRGLKHHNRLTVSMVKSLAWWVLCSGPHKADHPELLHLEYRAVFHAPQAVGRIQLPADAGLRSVWLLAVDQRLSSAPRDCLPLPATWPSPQMAAAPSKPAGGYLYCFKMLTFSSATS